MLLPYYCQAKDPFADKKLGLICLKQRPRRGPMKNSKSESKISADAAKWQWYQFRKELDWPIYVRFHPNEFDHEVGDFLTLQKFHKLSETEGQEAYKKVLKDSRAKVLTMKDANIAVARQITSLVESDRYGEESIVAQIGYKVYRMKNLALMIYSFNSKEWEIGIIKGFGSKQELWKSKIVLNRFLSFSLQSFGVVGFWGVPIDEGMVVQRYQESRGEAVFIDVQNEQVISLDGIKKLSPRFKVLRLDPTLKNRNIKMTQEELLSFLSSHCSFFDLTGLTVPVRQMVQKLARMTEGLYHPEESFKPRTDLSL